MALTVPTTTLRSGGGYSTTTPTLQGGAGSLKPMGGGGGPLKTGKAHVSPFTTALGGRKGSSGTRLRSARKIISNVNTGS